MRGALYALALLNLHASEAAVKNILEYGAVTGQILNGVGNFNAIKAAFDAAADGDDVFVPPGDFYTVKAALVRRVESTFLTIVSTFMLVLLY
jgi:hypothetical protein